MKKTYITPILIVWAVNSEKCILSSNSITTIEIKEENFNSETMTSLSHQSSLWDDEE